MRIHQKILCFPTITVFIGFCLLGTQPIRAQLELTTPKTTPLTLWYQTPALKWTDALPIGNGRLGAMIFGNPHHEKMQLNDITVWSGGPRPNANRSNAYQALPEIRSALSSGDYALAQELVGAKMKTSGREGSAYDGSYQTLGDLTFDYDVGSGPVSDYRRWLDISSAVCGVNYTANGNTYLRESFASHPDHVLVTHITGDHPGAISFSVNLSRAVSATTVSDGKVTLVMRGNTDMPAHGSEPKRKGNLEYEVRLQVQTVGGILQTTDNSPVVT